MLSRNLEKTLHRALAYANERRHEHATLEHLLLALTEDQDAVAVLRACGVDFDGLRREILNYVDNELGNLVATHGDDAKPTASLQRVLQRAAIHVQSSSREEVTGANVLVAMFAERESHAVYYLQEQDMTRFDAVNYISYGIAKAPGRSETRRVQGTEEGDRGPVSGPGHRIIEKPGGWPAAKQLRCSFCGKSQHEARKLIAGPGVFICDECVDSCVSLLRAEVFSQRLERRQAQTPIMTPQLQRAIEMLQLSNLELAEFIDHEIKQNPLLERHDGGPGEAPAANDPRAEERPDQPETVAGDYSSDAGEFGQPESGEAEDHPVDFGSKPLPCNGGFDQEGRPGLHQTAGRGGTLRERLLEQIEASLSDQGDRLIALHLLDLLDETGYLRVNEDAYLRGGLEGVAQLLGCGTDRVESVLVRLQQFDPAGVFARDLKECLALQLRDRNRLDPAMQALLDHLPLLATRNVPALVRVCRVEAADVAEMIKEIKSLDPRPGLAFDPPLAQPVVPDTLMRALPDGGWMVELNAETLPRVRVNHSHYARDRQGAGSKAEKDYLTERLHAANWLVKSLHQRAATILKVAAEIVRHQDAFFCYGVPSLRPLTRRDIANAIGMHESTVSRATSNKYIATPRGLYELKYFFTE